MALRIKPNIDLKELKKFGFTYTIGEDWHRYYDNVLVSLGDNKELIFDLNDYDYCETELLQLIILIYDLTKANLVEKVDDKR